MLGGGLNATSLYGYGGSNMKWGLLLALGVFVILISCKDNSTEPEAIKEKVLKTEEVIFFSSDRDGKAKNIFMMSSKGSLIKQITKYTWGEYAATAISPDKNQLLFYQAAPGLDIDVGMDIYIYKIKEDSIIGPITQGHPGNFSPDGKMFVFHRHTFTTDGGFESVYLYDLTKNTEKRISEEGKTSFYAQISPDGKFICYESSSLRNVPVFWQLHLMDVNGNFITDLTDAINSYWAGNGVFTPDSKSVLFHYSNWVQGYEICKVDIVSKQIKRLTKIVAPYFNYWNPSISTFSNTIYFYGKRFDEKTRKYYTQICACDIEGANFNVILSDSFWNSHPIADKVSYYIYK
ncbi:MAG: hypothetical protein FD143_3153 [Ignavibacteria bacterium]|nr:MAG: hypothetical protein FD143_3153 [Ignavibacteria bacterium]KAF0154268.1 MAG: hypothetical protein FD188_3280 [Ignavibacteria bacterium]